MSFNQLDALYRRVIMEHYKSPRNKGVLDDSNLTVDMNNPTCGDRIRLTMKKKDGKIEDEVRGRVLHIDGFRLDDDRSDKRKRCGNGFETGRHLFLNGTGKIMIRILTWAILKPCRSGEVSCKN